MIQAAYDREKPNGRWRDQSDRVVYIFRLYRRLSAPGLGSITAGGSFLAPATDAVSGFLRSGRNAIRKGLGAMQGAVLEREYRFVLIPERERRNVDFRTAFTYTRDGYFIDTPAANAKGIARFVIGGRTHHTPVYVNGVAVDGDAAIKDFVELIEDKFSPKSGRPSDYELRWIDAGAAVSAQDPFGEFEWTIHPVAGGVRIQRDAQRPFTRSFEFEFAGLQSNRDLAKAEDGFLAGLFSRGLLGTLLDKLGISQVQAALDDVFGVVEEVQGLMDDVNSVAVAVTDYVNGAAQFIRGSVGTIRSLALSAQELVGRVEDGIALAKSLPDIASDEWKRLTRDWPGLSKSNNPAVTGIVAIDELRRVQDFLLAVAAQPSRFAARMGSADAAAETVVERISPGATIDEIAARYQVSVDALIAANGLSYPFVDARDRPDSRVVGATAALQVARGRLTELVEQRDSSGLLPTSADYVSLQHQVDRAAADVARAEAEIETWAAEGVAAPAEDRVLYAGDALRVPLPSARVAPSVIDPHAALSLRLETITGRPFDVEDGLFGLDLALVDKRLVWSDATMDLELERGIQHMARVQVRYVLLPFGGLWYAPGIGNFAWEAVNQWAGPAANRLLAYSLWKTLRQDPRVAEVSDVRSATKAGIAWVYHSVKLINGRSVTDLRVPVE